MIRCNANLFRIAYACASTDETRDYLQGVYVEPHPQGGVLLVTTDGHRMLVVRDETGFADETAVIKLKKDALKHCKSKRGDCREIVIDSGMNEAAIRLVSGTADEPEYSPLAIAYRVRVDGPYPDYRRVIPQTFEGGMPAFNGGYLGSFGDIGKDLAEHVHGVSRETPAMRLTPNNSGPAVITWPDYSDLAFGVLMPMRALDADTIPAWFAKPTAPQAKAA